MSFFGDLGSAALGLIGGSSRDNAGAKQSVTDFTNTTNGATNDYVYGANGLAQQSGQLAKQNYYGTAQDAYGLQQQNYAQQGTAAQMLYNQATGAMPSAADLQMQQGLGNANNQVQSAMLSQQGGVSPGLSQRNMLNAQAAQNGSIVGQGMINRIQEQNQAQQNYSALLGQMGTTAANMQSGQMALGQAQYQQGQNNLNFDAQNWQNQYAARTGAAQNIFNAYQGNLTGQTAAMADASAKLGNTATAIATMGASTVGGKAAGASK